MTIFCKDIYGIIVYFTSLDKNSWFSLRLVNKEWYLLSEKYQHPLLFSNDILDNCIMNHKINSFFYLLKDERININNFPILCLKEIIKYKYYDEKLAYIIMKKKLNLIFLNRSNYELLLRWCYEYKNLELLKQITLANRKFHCINEIEISCYESEIDYLNEYCKIYEYEGFKSLKNDMNRFMKVFKDNIIEKIKQVRSLLLEHKLVSFEEETILNIVEEDDLQLFLILREHKVIEHFMLISWVYNHKKYKCSSNFYKSKIFNYYKNNLNKCCDQEINWLICFLLTNDGTLEDISLFCQRTILSNWISNYIEIIFEKQRFDILDFFMHTYKVKFMYEEILLCILSKSLEKFMHYIKDYIIDTSFKRNLLNSIENTNCIKTKQYINSL